MPASDSPHHILDTPTKNRLVGYYLATGNAAEAARRENVKIRTAQRVIKQYKETGSVSRKPRPGRPKKLTPYDERHIVRLARQNRRMPFREITNILPTRISESTVRRVLAARGYHRRVARRVPFINRRQRWLRKYWGQLNKKRTKRYWQRVIYSDECYVCLGEKNGRVFVTRRKDEKLLDDCVVPTFKQPNLRVMVWGCIAEGRKGPLVVVEYPGGKGKGLNSKRYQEQILDAALLPFYNQLKEERKYVRFQQDGASPHRSKSTLKWFRRHQVPLVFHPPNSPDLTPIEPVWLELKRIIRELPHQPTTLEGLKAAIRAAWNEIPLDFINAQINRMSDRVRVVLKAKGGHTGF